MADVEDYITASAGDFPPWIHTFTYFNIRSNQGSDGEDSTEATAGGDTPPRGGWGSGVGFGASDGGADDEDAALAAAIAASLSDQRPEQSGGASGGGPQSMEEEAAAVPLPEEPEAGAGAGHQERGGRK